MAPCNFPGIGESAVKRKGDGVIQANHVCVDRDLRVQCSKLSVPHAGIARLRTADPITTELTGRANRKIIAKATGTVVCRTQIGIVAVQTVTSSNRSNYNLFRYYLPGLSTSFVDSICLSKLPAKRPTSPENGDSLAMDHKWFRVAIYF